MQIILVLIICLVAFTAVLFGITFLNRRNKTTEVNIIKTVDPDCCGAHEVCERESLLNSDNKVIYFDDEELDDFSGIDSRSYTPDQLNQFSEVFYTLKESDMAGWLRSLQMRNIQLPADLKDAAFMIIQERRGSKSI